MSARAAAGLAWLLWALCVALAVLVVGLDFYTPPPGHEPYFEVLPGIPLLVYPTIGALALLVYPTIGALVVSHRPKNAVGWVLCGMGLVFEVWAFADYLLFVQPGSQPGENIILLLTSWGTRTWTLLIAVVLGAVLLLLLFPDGRLVARSWWAVVWMAVSGAALMSLWWVTWPHRNNPIGIGGALGDAIEQLGRLGGVFLLVSCLASVFSVFVRLASAGGRERQQIKWFAYAAAVLVGALLFGLSPGQLQGTWTWSVVVVTGLSGVPVAVGIAILRYRLYDIDVLINRTLVYGVLTGILALVYFGGVTATHTIFRTLTGQERQSQLAIVISTLVIAALFNPLRRRIQSFIDRRFYRKKYDAAKTLEAFSAKLRDETDLDALSDDLVGVVRETMQPAHVSLWLRPDPPPKGQPSD
jgi:hypothetical protein